MNPQHVEQISTVVSHDGFFIANCKNSHRDIARQSMVGPFAEAGMKIGVVNMDNVATRAKLADLRVSLARSENALAGLQNDFNRRVKADPLRNEFWVVAYDDQVLKKH